MQFDSARADRIAALVLFALGLAMLISGYTMDRLEIRQIHPASIPGLVPIILGAVLALCAVLLYASAGSGRAAEAASPGGASWRDLGLALALCLVYALVLVGRVPFFWATTAFIAAFAAWFAWPDADGSKLRTVARAMAFAVLASGAISALFRYGFLVRLP
jgi:putative tricarboxylic transport membrane protein